MIAIIDYGSGNLAAIANIYKQLKVPHIITSDESDIRKAEKYVLPGVGAFDATMKYLQESGLVDLLNEQVLEGKKKVLGICVGMQILGDSSEEGEFSGLGWIHGRIRKIDVTNISSGPRLPHMGWNSVLLSEPSPTLFDGVDLERGYYFLHSYYFDAADDADVIATVEYGNVFPCAVMHENIYGVQFHPEKSHSNGVAIFRNFAEC